MELIPILSLIVLVATISTFILAIGAYVLYKVRESKGRKSVARMPQAVEAELYAPQGRLVQPEIASQSVYQEPEIRQGRAAYAQVQSATAPQRTPEYTNGGEEQQETESQDRNSRKFMKYTSEGYIPVSKTTKTGENLKWR